MNNVVKSFDIVTASFERPIQLFSDLYLTKLLGISVKIHSTYFFETFKYFDKTVRSMYFFEKFLDE